MSLIIAVDTGGTFTDLAAYDTDTRMVRHVKSLTTYGDLVEGVMGCIAKAGLDLRRAQLIKFGTTLVINTYVQRNGARTALISTKGFRDTLELRRGNRPAPFDIRYARHPPLVERGLRLEIDERTDSDGAVLRDVEANELEAIIERLRDLRVEAVAVSLFNSYANSATEDKVAAALRACLPGVYISSGVEISREWHEYERASTAVANAYVGPRITRYISGLDQALRQAGFTKSFFLMASNGGVVSAERAARRPVTLVESGPVGGIIGAGAYGLELGFTKVVGFDMGGTTAKCAVIEEGRFEVKSPYYVGGEKHGFPVRGGVLDIVEVGAGGGSIALIDPFGRLSVGPQSAGSEPGPLCYGRGGAEVTVTDANLVLGRIGSGSFLGGEMRLDEGAAQKGLARLAAAFGLAGDEGVDEMAQGVLDLAGFTMASAVRQITIERGIDPRDYMMVAYGGGGPLHSLAVAREVGLAGVIIPPQPGVFSALGMVLSDARVDETQTFNRALTENSIQELLAAFEALEARIGAEMKAELGEIDLVFERQVDMRFTGQHHSARMHLPEPNLEAVRRRYEAEYERRFGHVRPAPLEFVKLILSVTAAMGRLKPRDLASTGPSEDAPPSRRSVYFAESKGRIETAVHQREHLPEGFADYGPAVIEEYGSTTVIGPHDHFRVGALGEIQITFGGSKESDA